MSIYIDRLSLEKEPSEEIQISCVPCKIEHNGDARVNEYFRTLVKSPSEEKGEKLSGSLRGRNIHGINMELPKDFTGIIIKEDRKPYLEDEDRRFKVTHRFQTFEYWNWDKEPSANDKMNKIMVWPEIAAAIHSPVGTDSSLQTQDSKSSVSGKR